MFEPPLLGPYEVVRYKDKDKYVVVLQDDMGQQWDCAASHVVLMHLEETFNKKVRV